MRSPFPGMDPWLELEWPDVHHRLVHDFCDALAESMPGDLIARMERRVVIEDGIDDPRAYRPDTSVWETGVFGQAGALATLDAEPDAVVVSAEPLEQAYIKIRDDADRLITVVEFLSPSNKVGRGLEEYLAKREQLLAASVNVLEIDLVRAGDWRSMVPPSARLRRETASYRILTWYASARGTVVYRPMRLDARLPDVRVPLRGHDPAVRIELQPLVDRAYELGRYHRTDYTRPLPVPLGDAERSIAQPLLAARGTAR